ncbi:MAG: CBO0543 family protein [Syntrophomonas sp.]
MLKNLVIYVPMIAAILALIIKWREMKPYIPAGLFASLFANILCHIAMHLNWWTYPYRIEEPIVNCIIVPVLAMYWIRYAPTKIFGLVVWDLLWTGILTTIEYYVERITNIIKYSDGYHWYYSLLLWFISWFIWYGFHIWFNIPDET